MKNPVSCFVSPVSTIPDGGWIILDKPAGMTSRRVGGIVARMFGIKKFGHLGTLDPFATGVLPIALGEATKMIPYLERMKDEGRTMKEYEFSIKWGIQTDTDDITGNIIKTSDSSPFILLPSSLSSLTGEIEQTPPAYSAVHINGRRAYELARAGQTVDMPKRRVRIYSLSVIPAKAGSHCAAGNLFHVECSSGTYIRTLVGQIAALSGQIATCETLRRTRTHGFEIKDAVTLDFLENLYNNDTTSVLEYLKPIDFGLDDIPVVKLNADDAALFQNGGFIKNNNVGLGRVYVGDTFIGIGNGDGGELRPQRIIKEQ